MAEDWRALAPFSAIQSKTPFPITVHVESKGTALITASSEYADKLHLVKTDVNNDILTISYTGQQTFSTAFSTSGGVFTMGNMLVGNMNVLGGVYINGQRVDNIMTLSGTLPDIQINVTIPMLRSIGLEGTGSVTVAATELNVLDLAVNITGTGHVILPPIRADSVHVTLSGCGPINLVGTARRLSVRLSGVGDLDALALAVEEADVTLSGIGQVKVNVTRRLSGAISGMGDIGYKGNPQQIDVRQFYTGRIYQIP